MSALPDSIWFNALKRLDKQGKVVINIPCENHPDAIKDIKTWLKNKKHRAAPTIKSKLAPIKYQYRPKAEELRVTIAVHNYILRQLKDVSL